MRRQKVPPDMAEEIAPKNILMIGPTGVGKTEIARRLARLAQSPFVKVEASKFTEVGYVGRDVESMVRDLVELGIDMVREERLEEVRGKAAQNAEDRLLDILLPPARPIAPDDDPAAIREPQQTRERFREQLRAGRLDARVVEMDVREKSFPSFEIIAGSSVEEVDINLKDMLPGLFQGQDEEAPHEGARSARVPDAGRGTEAHRHGQRGADRGRARGAGGHHLHRRDRQDRRPGRQSRPDVSREGVQRDILPIVEGTTVNTKYGMVRTDHILFIAAGAFHVSKPSDLIPELQGRFPIRVELEALGKDEFVRILTEPRSALVKQYIALMETEGIDLTFTDDGIHQIADFATIVNERTENIGARRLHTVMEKLLDEISFEGPDLENKTVVIDEAYVTRMLADIVKNEDLSRILSRRHFAPERSTPDPTINAEAPRSSQRISLCDVRVPLIVVISLSACGKKGPPLPPLVRLPVAPADFNAARRGDTVDLQFTVPSTNTDRTRPANVERVDVYAITGAGALSGADVLKRGARVGSVAVKAPRNPDETIEPDEPADDIEPLEGRGLDQGAVARIDERLTAGALTPAAAGADRSKPAAAAPEASGPLLSVWMLPLPARTYVGVGVSKSGRKGPPSRSVAVPLLPPPPPPETPTVSYSETEITVTWSPLSVSGPATPGNLLPSRPIGEVTPALGYNVYEVPSPSGSTGAIEVSLTATPVAEARFSDPRITWDATRCYAVRAVQSFSDLTVESDERAPACVTLKDIFAPVAPKGLTAVASEGAISLIWEANEEKDLDGYLVLRGGGPAGEELKSITPAAIHETNFRDVVPPAVRFTYAVQAVDKAGNASPISTRVEEAAR